jgi:hypothetical protein
MSEDPLYSNIPLLITFLKSYKRAYLGLDEQGETVAVAKAESEDEELVPLPFRERFRNVFQDYFKTAGKALVKGQTVSPVTDGVSTMNIDRCCLTSASIGARQTQSRGIH